MDQIKSEKHKPGSFISETAISLLLILKSKYFYIGLVSLIFGACLNFASQIYLHHYVSEGKTLPMLSDLILDNVPIVDVSLIYDIFSLVVFAVVVIYLVHRKDLNRLPYILLLSGIFYIIRGIFIVLTPFGNPPEFQGSDPLFNGFSLYELGVYPSGHVGDSFLLLLLVNDKVYKYILSFCLAVIIITLIIAHSHYSIDILSGFFFAYAIKAFGDKYLKAFELSTEKTG